MFEYSVITPAHDKEQTFFIVPLSDEEQFVNGGHASTTYESVRLDLMLEILNGYQVHAHGHLGNFETEHYRYSREQLDKGMLAKVVKK